MLPKRSPNHIITRRDIHAGEINAHLEHITREFREGFNLLARHPKSVTIFGSSLASRESASYRNAEEIAGRVASELGYTVITGGGPGIMEAANKGAYEAGGSSVGMTISLPHNRTANTYVNDSMHFSYFFSRKTLMTFAAEAYIFMPGGYGTLDELFSILTLIQTDKIPRVPIILFDSHFWSSFTEFMQKAMLKDFNTIAEHDLDFMEITDSIDRVVEIVKTAPVREWTRNIN